MDSYLVAYDISHPKRLRKVARVCEDFGLRYQFSVFICRLTSVALVRLKARLHEIINLTEDQVIVMPICGKCVEKMETLGRPSEAPESKDVVIVT